MTEFTHRSRRVQYVATFSVSVAFVVLGMLSAWSSPVMPKFKRKETAVEVDDTGMSWMVAVSPIGFILGSFVTRYTSDKLGRKVSIICSALPVAIGTVIVVFALKAWLLCITTFLWSSGTGMLSSVSGMYLAEISDKDIRGTLNICTRFAFNLGNLLVMAGGPFVSYETLNWCLLPLPFVYFFGCLWIPETPYYLLKEGRVEDARKEMKRLRGYADEVRVSEELISMQASVKNEMSSSSTYRELFSGKQYRRAVIVAAGLKFTQIMSGGVTIKQYLGIILQEAKVGQEHEQTVFLLFSGISFLVSIVSSILVDRVSRRALLISSYLGTALSLTSVGIYFFLLDVVQADHTSLAKFGFVPFLGIIMSNVISTFGFIALSAVIPAEIFPLNIKAIAMTSLSIFGGVLGFSVGKGYQNVKDLLGGHTVFWIFAAVSFGGGLFSYFVVPETKGKTLNEIQMELQVECKADNVANDTELEVIKLERKEST